MPWLAPPASAAQVLGYDFDGPGGALELSADTLAPGLSAAPWSDLDGVLASAAGNPGLALSSRSFHDGNGLILALTVLPGYVLTLDGFAFDQRASNTGPTSWGLSIAGAELANGTTSTTFADRSGVLGLGDLAGDIVIAVSGAGASSSAGTWRIDNFSLTGAVNPVPLPPSLLFLLSSVIGLVGMRFCSSR
jgi:hypothetical protein